MDPAAQQLLQRAFVARAKQGPSPIQAAICAAVGTGPSLAVIDLYDRFYRIASAIRPEPTLLLAALHALTLHGAAPALAAYFPSCGGDFAQDEDGTLGATVDETIRRQRDDLLDFMLGQEPRSVGVTAAAPVLLGALATVAQFGGGLSLVEIGAATGLTLRFDRYAYQLGPLSMGASPVTVNADLSAGAPAVQRLLQRGMPIVMGRAGLESRPVDLSDPEEQLAIEAFLPPDDMAAIEQFHRAATLAQACPVNIATGFPATDLLSLLLTSYQAMEPGNTLFVYQTELWPHLGDGQRQATTFAVQRLASQLSPHKPMAWLQVERFTAAPVLDVRLQTFGWADPEDRTVRQLAEVDPQFRHIRWLER